MRAALVLVACCVAASRAVAQGTLSAQGFGYPPGPFSVRNMALGGALAEVDAHSPVNPAASLAWVASGLTFQYSPEFRRVKAGNVEDRATVIRFPLVAAAIAFRERLVIAGSASTYLDRTWATEQRGVLRFGRDSAPFVETFRSAGAISDFRLAAAWAAARPFHVGLALDVFGGSNRLELDRTFSDTTSFTSFSQRSRVSYAGFGAAAGITWQPVRRVELGASARAGGRIRSYRNDTVLTRARVPHRLGGSARYTIGPTTVAAHLGWEGWSRLQPLVGGAAVAHDAWDFGAGAEVRTPAVFGAALPLRLGVRRRTLPFDAGTGAIRETTIGGGLGLVMARQRLLADFSVQRAARSGAPAASERGWILGFGLVVRP